MTTIEQQLTQGIIRDGYPFALGWALGAMKGVAETGDTSGLLRIVEVIERALDARDAARRADVRAAIDALSDLTGGQS